MTSPDEDLFGPPPRKVDLSARLELLVAGTMRAHEWLLLAVMMALFGVIAGQAPIFTEAALKLGHHTAQGLVLAERVYNYEEGTINHNPDREFWYEYAVDGTPFVGRGYGLRKSLKVGQPIEVQVSEFWPTVSQVEGLRPRDGSLWGVLLLVVFLFILGLDLRKVPSRIPQQRLLSQGVFTYAKATGSRSALEEDLDERTVFILDFSFEDQQGQTHHTSVRTSWEELKQDYEPLLYLPSDPANCVLLDEFFARPVVGDEGQLTSPRSAVATVAHVSFIVLTVIAPFVALWLTVVRPTGLLG